MQPSHIYFCRCNEKDQLFGLQSLFVAAMQVDYIVLVKCCQIVFLNDVYFVAPFALKNCIFVLIFSLYFIFAFVHVVFFAPLPPDGSYLLHQTGPKLFFDPHKHPEMWNIGQGEDWEIKGRIYLEQSKILRWQLVLLFMIFIRKEMLNNDTQTRNL